MNPKPILITTGCAIAIVVGAYFVGRLYIDIQLLINIVKPNSHYLSTYV